MSKLRLMLGAACTVATLSLATATGADAAPHGVRVGDLTCNVASGWGFVFGSSKDLHCTFRGNGHMEHYTGSISKFGVDIGYTGGDYAGASAQATIGVGLGANVLVGGLDKSIALQPLSVSGEKGLNVAAGIGSISLHAAS